MHKIKIFVFVSLVAVCLCTFLPSCARLNIHTAYWDMNANTFCKEIQVPETTVSIVTSKAGYSNTSICVKGYHSTVNAAAFESIMTKVMEDVVAMGIKAWVMK